MEHIIRDALASQYALRVLSLAEVPGGWSARAFSVQTNQGGFFVKAYDKQRPSIQQWIDRVDMYMPVVLWLDAHTTLRGRISAPVLTGEGAYKVDSEGWLLLVFPLIDGETLCEKPLDTEQTRQLADILATLHAHSHDIPFPPAALQETYALPFLDRLHAALDMHNTPQSLQNALPPHLDMLAQATDALQHLADTLRKANLPMSLCHTDVHGWNLMWDGHLILIDWEGLQLAPVEADLFSFTDGFFFDYAGEAFFTAYGKAREGFAINETAMTFYRMRRRLEDIAEFAFSIASDGLSQPEAARSLRYLEKECQALARQMRR